MGTISLIRWFCSTVTKKELREAVEIFLEVLDDKRDDIKLKKEFRDNHPNYRKFSVDATPPFVGAHLEAKPHAQLRDWRLLLEDHFQLTGRHLQPIKRKPHSFPPPSECCCEHCGAPSEWLSVNDGRKRSQVICKVCKGLSPVKRMRFRSDAKYRCPHCDYALYVWKSNDERTLYKCSNDKCPHYLQKREALNKSERELSETGMGSQFKLRYQWREYHYDPTTIRPESPKGPRLKINSSLHTLGLVLAYCVSYGMSARMTARVLKEVHGIDISYQTVLNWLLKAAPLAWNVTSDFTKKAKDVRVAADETYIKICGVWHYTWFVIGSTSKAILGWNVTDNRSEKSAIAVLNQTLDSRSETGETLELIGDGNPSYDAAANAINTDKDGLPLPIDERKIVRRTVIGLKNSDDESKLYRPFKNLIERLNRTYRYHTRSRSGFKDLNSAQALTTLFVAYYNFMRPHKSLKYSSPISIPELNEVQTIQGRWLKLLQLSG